MPFDLSRAGSRIRWKQNGGHDAVRWLWCCLVLTTLVPLALSGQTLRGLITDRQTGTPISGAWFVVIDAAGTRDSTQSGMMGLVEISAPQGVALSLLVYRDGYEAAELPELRLTEDAPPFLQIALQASTFRLTAIEVAAEGEPRQRHLENVGFYGRQEEGRGVFLTREELEALRPQYVTDALRHMPLVSVSNNPSFGKSKPGGVGRDMRRVVISVSRSMASLRGSSSCPPLIFWDGVLLGDAEEVVLDNAVSVVNVEAIEVYRGATIPAQFNTTGSACGVIVLWSRS